MRTGFLSRAGMSFGSLSVSQGLGGLGTPVIPPPLEEPPVVTLAGRAGPRTRGTRAERPGPFNDIDQSCKPSARPARPKKPRFKN